MKYCSKCLAEGEEPALVCARCSSYVFLHSRPESVQHGGSDEYEVIQAPGRERRFFHRESFLVFFLGGPLIGAMGAGVFKDTGGMPIFVLVPIYFIGGFFAAIGWLIFTIGFNGLYHFFQRASVQRDPLFNKVVLVFFGTAFGALGNSILLLIGCSLRYFVGYDAIGCFARIVSSEWTLWLLPGIVCGSVSALLLEDRLCITNHSTGRADKRRAG